MDDDRAPAVVEDLALGAFRMVKEKLGFELDFSPETLPVLDHYLSLLRDEGEGRPEESLVAIAGPCAGAYFGEVARRSVPGLRWHCPPDDYQRWRIEASHVFLAFNPVGMALEALYLETLGDWRAHFALLPAEKRIVDRSLASAAPVREDDFYRLAVRHEVLEQALDVLTGLAEIKNERTSFGPEVYAAALDQDPSDAKA